MDENNTIINPFKQHRMKYEDNPKSIKFYIKRFIVRNREKIRGMTIIDFPAGNGVTSRIIKEYGAHVYPFDLFPEYFNVEGLSCRRATIAEGLPVKDNFADMLICQEGIEHFSDQLEAFKEFSRVLKTGGMLLITTPNYSNLRAKLSYLLSESERFGSMMAPNELDSIWMNQQKISNEIYYGHISLIGIQKLRFFARLAGFKITKIHPTKTKSTSVGLFLFLYPFIVLFNWLTYRKNLKKGRKYSKEIKNEVYGEMFSLSINPRILTCGNLMVEFVKENDSDDMAEILKSRDIGFGIT